MPFPGQGVWNCGRNPPRSQNQWPNLTSCTRLSALSSKRRPRRLVARLARLVARLARLGARLRSEHSDDGSPKEKSSHGQVASRHHAQTRQGYASRQRHAFRRAARAASDAETALSSSQAATISARSCLRNGRDVASSAGDAGGEKNALLVAWCARRLLRSTCSFDGLGAAAPYRLRRL